MYVFIKICVDFWFVIYFVLELYEIMVIYKYIVSLGLVLYI